MSTTETLTAKAAVATQASDGASVLLPNSPSILALATGRRGLVQKTAFTASSTICTRPEAG